MLLTVVPILEESQSVVDQSMANHIEAVIALSSQQLSFELVVPPISREVSVWGKGTEEGTLTPLPDY